MVKVPKGIIHRFAYLGGFSQVLHPRVRQRTESEWYKKGTGTRKGDNRVYATNETQLGTCPGMSWAHIPVVATLF